MWTTQELSYIDGLPVYRPHVIHALLMQEARRASQLGTSFCVLLLECTDTFDTDAALGLLSRWRTTLGELDLLGQISATCFVIGMPHQQVAQCASLHQALLAEAPGLAVKAFDIGAPGDLSQLTNILVGAA